MKDSDLLDALANQIASSSSSDFTRIVGGDIMEYGKNDSYRIIHTEGSLAKTTMLEQSEPIYFDDILRITKEGGPLTNQAIRKVLCKTKLVTMQGNERTFNAKTLNAIEAMVLFEDTEFFLHKGHWYYIPDSAEKQLGSRFNALLDRSKADKEQLEQTHPLSASHLGVRTENAFNEALQSRKEIVVGHEATIQNIELADLIIPENNSKIYLLHN